MLSQIVGSVDFNAAMVLAVLIICLCIVATSLIVKRRSRLVLSNEFELAKLKEGNEREAKAYQLQTDREFKFKQVDQNLITSHSRD